MTVTLEQAKALDALVTHGSYEEAAKALRKRHTAVVYAIRTMEEQLGLVILDRSGYRTKLTVQGQRVHRFAKDLLDAEARFTSSCEELRLGWEPRLRVVVDGIVPMDPILEGMKLLLKQGSKTQMDIRTAFLSGVEEAFLSEEADMMISVTPVRTVGLVSKSLNSIRATLVAHSDHPLSRGKQKQADLEKEVLLTVRGSDKRLELSTSLLQPSFQIELNDFYAKKKAILSNIGYGWMPEYLINTEIKDTQVKEVVWEGLSHHLFEPRLYFSSHFQKGPSATLFLSVWK